MNPEDIMKETVITLKEAEVTFLIQLLSITEKLHKSLKPDDDSIQGMIFSMMSRIVLESIKEQHPAIWDAFNVEKQISELDNKENK